MRPQFNNKHLSQLGFTTTLLLILASLWLGLSVSADADPRPTIAIIIDDLGDDLEAGSRVLAMPAPVTPSIMPHTAHGETLAKLAAEQGLSVMIHMPMEAVGKRQKSRFGALTTAMRYQEFARQFNINIEALPQVSGLNNHMGSRLTQNRRQMRWLMKLAKKRQLYFIDSRTTPNTQAENAAIDLQVPHARRDVFLDNDPAESKIRQKLIELQKLADENGSAIAIGHPYPSTLRVLEQELPEISTKYRIIPASDLTIADWQTPSNSGTISAVNTH